MLWHYIDILLPSITWILENLFNAAIQVTIPGIIFSKCWKMDEQRQHGIVEYLSEE